MPSIDVEALVHAVGYPGLFAMIFAETGLLIGIFLPGDTLLITAGLVAQRGALSLWWLLPVLIVAAILGDATGYVIGRRAGPLLFRKEEGRIFKRGHLLKAERFYERHGGKTITIAQFMPIVRTFAPVVAGAAAMPYRRFATFNVLGAVLWINSMLFIGFFLVKLVPGLEKRIDLVVAIVIFLSLLPAITAWLKAKLTGGKKPVTTDEVR